MEKLFYFDLETTGTMYWRNGIHQISGCIEIDGEVKEEFDFKTKPHPKCTYDTKALEVGKITKETIEAYTDMGIVYNKIIEMLSKYVNKFDKTDKFYLVGYNNAAFDNAFFRAFFVQNNDNYFGSWFWSDSQDVMVMASYYLKDVRKNMESLNLMTVAKAVGIEVDESKLHDATYDIYLTREIYKKINKK